MTKSNMSKRGPGRGMGAVDKAKDFKGTLKKLLKRISEYNQIIDQLEHYTIQELNFQSKSEYVPLVGKKEFHFQENTNTVPIGLTYNIKYGVKTENRALVGVMIPEEDSIENIQVMVLKEDYSSWLADKILTGDTPDVYIILEEDYIPTLIEANLYDAGMDVPQLTNGPLFGDRTKILLEEVYSHKG